MMKKTFDILLVFIALILILFSPFYYLNIKEKWSWLYHRNEFIKIKVKIDSVFIPGDSGRYGATGPDPTNFYLYYNNKRIVKLHDGEGSLFYNKKESLRTKQALNSLESYRSPPLYIERLKFRGYDYVLETQDNDSLLIWHHPRLNGRFALVEEAKMNTDGFLMQIIINVLLLIMAVYCIVWQIKEWRKPKKVNGRN